MLSACGRLFCNNLGLTRFTRGLSKLDNFIVSEEVRTALRDEQAVVALESTIITHGMPYPENVKCALEVEAIVRSQGAVPATVAIIEGQVRVGLDANETTWLGDVKNSQPIKTSRRDFGYVVSTGRSGGTTVSGTMLVAGKVGIPIFATGGIGGVHRGGETTLDISADLTELGRSGVAVVSSGVKSILDIPKTLEYLETQGVFVATFGGGKDFPAFYSRKSGYSAPYSVETAQEAAKIIHCSQNFDLQSGMLFAVPVPEKFSLDEGVINGVIQEALKDAERIGIRGKEITPFLLGRIGEITAGKSLETNIALIKNNARTAACIAVELSKLKNRKASGSSGSNKDEVKDAPTPVVIGGSNLDCSVKLQVEEIKLDGRIHFGKSVMSGGGVARNICESLSKLGCRHVFISVVGNDPQGDILKNFIPQDNLDGVKVLEGRNTGQCTIVLDRNGECKFLVGDMEIHQHITPEMILDNEEVIKHAPLLVFDANLSIPTIETILKLAERYNVPVFFEPTDVEVCTKPYQTTHWRPIKFITPNFNELKQIAAHFHIIRKDKYQDKFDEVVHITGKLVEFVDNVIVTLGADGVVVGRKGKATESFLAPNRDKLEIRHYIGDRSKKVTSVSGAGDNLASGVIAAMLSGLTEEECLSVGLSAAEAAIAVAGPVPDKLFSKKHASWRSKAPYRTLV